MNVGWTCGTSGNHVQRTTTFETTRLFIILIDVENIAERCNKDIHVENVYDFCAAT